MKTVFLLIRIPLVLLALLTVTLLGYGFYYQYMSAATIERARLFDDAAFRFSAAQSEQQTSDDVVIVQFFDFNDAESYKLHTLFRDALADDPHVVFLIRPVGFRNAQSRDEGLFLLAARHIDAAKAHGLVQQFLNGGVPLAFDDVVASAKDIGFDIPAVRADMMEVSNRKTEFRNFQMFQDIGFKALPALTVGSRGFMYDPAHPPGVNFIKMMVLEERKVERGN